MNFTRLSDRISDLPDLNSRPHERHGGWWDAVAHFLRPMQRMQPTTNEIAPLTERPSCSPCRCKSQAGFPDASLVKLRQQMEEIQKELSHLEYVASHDLQEPLRMVSSYVTLLGDRYRGRLDGEADEFIHFAQDGALRMKQMVEGLLIYSRAGTALLNFEKISAESLVESAMRSAAPLIQFASARLTVDFLPDVVCDVRQITQVFFLLLDNALKFRRPKDSRIHIESQTEEQPDGMCQFTVSDNGIGFSQCSSERVFNLFQRLNSREDYPGAGVGLALCKRIIERHGGRIFAQGEPGTGASFSFTLPLG